MKSFSLRIPPFIPGEEVTAGAVGFGVIAGVDWDVDVAGGGW